MKIGIDASRCSLESATGVEWYSWHIINGILELLKNKNENIDLFFYSRDRLNLKGNFKNIIIPTKRLWTLLGLSKEMRKNPPDVLFVPSHTLPFNTPKKAIITIHDTAFKYLREAYSFFQFHYLNWSTKFAVKHAYKIIVPSQATANDLIRFYKCPIEKIVVIPHGFNGHEISAEEIDNVFKNSEVFKYFGINKNSDYLLFVGRLESKKNLERIVQAFKNFAETHPEFKLVLAGKRGVGFERILKTVNECQIMNKVIMPGYITEVEKAALYKYCKAFVFPSLYEGFGLPLLEAFYYKKPVITSHGSSLKEVGGDACYYVDPFDSGDILAGMDKIINDHEIADELIKKGSERLKLFSWKTCSEKTLEILKS